MISVERLTVRYGRKEALSNLSLAVEPGQVFVLLGRNGAGKSSLFRALLGLRRPDAGSVRVLGLDPWHERRRLASRWGATPESPDAPADQTVLAIERSIAPLFPRWKSGDFRDRLKRFAIDPKQRFGELSRGQKAMAMLSFALAHEPELLLLDDPTLGLDLVARRFFYEELVTELADRGTTVLLATHDVDAASRVASHLGILRDGRLVAQGSVESVAGEASLEDRFLELAGGDTPEVAA
jgi:ABC-2 type transport system ATP-binding protein